MTTHVIQVHFKIDAETPGDALQAAMKQYPDAESYRALVDSPDTPWYAETKYGNCSIIRARTAQEVKDEYASGELRHIRLATSEDIEHYESMGGAIR